MPSGDICGPFWGNPGWEQANRSSWSIWNGRGHAASGNWRNILKLTLPLCHGCCVHWRKADLVELTEQGHTMAKIWRGNYQKMEEIMLKGFSDQERAQFADYLIRAYHNFREREEEPLCKI